MKKKSQRNCVKQTKVLNVKKSFDATEFIVNLISIDIDDPGEISIDEKSEMVVMSRDLEFSMEVIFATIQIVQIEFEKTKKTKNKIMNKMIEKKIKNKNCLFRKIYVKTNENLSNRKSKKK